MSTYLVTGDRNWPASAADVIGDALEKLLPHQESAPHTVVHGGAPGVDHWAGILGKALGFHIRVFEADWNQHGKAAGPLRNDQMLALIPDRVLAFHDDILGRSKGTKDCVRKAVEFGMRTEVRNTNGNLYLSTPALSFYEGDAISFARILDAEWGEKKNLLHIKCGCGNEFDYPCDQWIVKCPYGHMASMQKTRELHAASNR